MRRNKFLFTMFVIVFFCATGTIALLVNMALTGNWDRVQVYASAFILTMSGISFYFIFQSSKITARKKETTKPKKRARPIEQRKAIKEHLKRKYFISRFDDCMNDHPATEGIPSEAYYMKRIYLSRNILEGQKKNEVRGSLAEEIIEYFSEKWNADFVDTCLFGSGLHRLNYENKSYKLERDELRRLFTNSPGLKFREIKRYYNLCRNVDWEDLRWMVRDSPFSSDDDD